MYAGFATGEQPLKNFSRKGGVYLMAEMDLTKTALGMEFGSTRIKAVLVDENDQPIASGSHSWENRHENGIWTYSLEDIREGMQSCYRALAAQVQQKYGVELTTVGALGFSGMMHGYLAFDRNDQLLVPFRTWRNTMTGEAAEKLTQEFAYNIPQRWSIAHLYQAIMNREEHVRDVAYFTTLAGYIHWQLTGRKVLGVGEASGMFPIDTRTGNYDQKMVQRFDELIADYRLGWTLEEILPRVLMAGEEAGQLTPEGAALLDPSGKLQSGIPLCPPEGDAGTGMVATNSVAPRTGNVSAGTSIFSMVVLEEPLKEVHEEIDLVTTPSGDLTAMVHCNNCTSEINAWVNLFVQFGACMGFDMDVISSNELYGGLYQVALEGEPDCGGLLSYNYFSGEPVTGLAQGRPLFVRTPDSNFDLANFMRMHIYSAMATLKIGNDILLKEEGVKLDQIYGHGGLFKTKGVGQKLMAAALDTPVAVMETAGEGGAWGIAVLAAYMKDRKEGQSLAAYLEEKVFAEQESAVEQPEADDVSGFDEYVRRYREGLAVEQTACDHVN